MAFTGKALYDNGVFGVETAEDVAPIVSMISPFETPLLDVLGDPQYPAYNILHEWTEEKLAPNTLLTSTALPNTTGDTAVQIQSGEGAFIMVGAVLTNEITGEYYQVVTATANTIVITRAFGGTSASSLGPGATLNVISDAALEGADVTVDISRPRTRGNNYCQIFKKDIIVSGSDQAVRKVGGIVSELDHQIQNRSREAIRDLEKAVIRGILSGNTIGSGSAYRTMKGLWSFISTNAQSVGTLTESWLGNVVKTAWDYGARDLDVIVCDANYKRVIDSWNATRIRTNPNDMTFRNIITEYESSFGTQRVVLSRWMPTNSAMVLSSSRIQVMPLQGRSLAYVPIARTGDSAKGMVLGEYTVELKNEEGFGKIYTPVT